MNESGLDVGGRIMLKWVFKKLYGGIDWIDLDKGRNRQRVMR